MQNTTSVSVGVRSETEILKFVVNHAFEHELPIAFWRLPNASTRFLIVSENYRTLQKNSSIEELQPGFIFAPFDRDRESLFLPGDFVFRFENSELVETTDPKESSSRLWLQERYKHVAKTSAFKTATVSGDELKPDHYVDLVNLAVDEIAAGRFEKVVVSRKKQIALTEDFDIVRTFEKLCASYPTALVSFVSIPSVGHWLGATPEALVSLDRNKIFRTVALAGTMPYTSGQNLKDIAWTQKDIEEQALVERYIISCFKKIRVREYDEHGPKTVVAGNVVHLKSDFEVDTEAIAFPQLASVMLQLLHPTSAVAGMPLDTALSFLKAHENYDREFYAGYLGPANIDSEIHLFVNLRCAKLLDGKAELFAGAGITIDSSADKEFNETELKFKTLLNILS